MTGYLVLFGPAIVYFVAGFTSAIRPGSRWWALLGVAAAGTLGWLVYVGMVPHQEGGRTFFGTTPVDDDDGMIWWYTLIAAVPSAAVGYLRLARPFAIGAAATIGPALLAYATTPQGDGDGLWLLIFLMLPFFGLMFTGVASLAKLASVVVRRRVSVGPLGR